MTFEQARSVARYATIVMAATLEDWLQSGEILFISPGANGCSTGAEYVPAVEVVVQPETDAGSRTDIAMTVRPILATGVEVVIVSAPARISPLSQALH